MPFRVKHVNKKTGVTYVYEFVSFWDKELKQSRNKQVCIGKIDPATLTEATKPQREILKDLDIQLPEKA